MIKKIPGFGTGKKWKTFIAILFYLTTIIIFLNPIGVTSIDKIIFIFSYLVIFGIPFVILLNLWEIRSKLPFFRDKTIKATIIGVFFTFVLVTGVVASASAFISPEQKRIDLNAAKQAEEEQKIKTEDKKVAKNLDNQILGLGKIDNLEMSKAGDVAKLFQDYESLTSSQKDYVTKYDLLISAEKKIKDLESEKIVAEKAAAEKAAAEKAAAEKAAAEKTAAEKAAAEKAAADKAAADKAAAEKAAADKAAADKAAAEKAAAEKAAAEKAAQKSEEEIYKEKCVDIPWAEVVKDRKTYVGAYLQKDLMVRELATLQTSYGVEEIVYICGENKGGGVYTGGTFTVIDRRTDKSPEIELYDKIYVYGQIEGIYQGWSMKAPYLEVQYVKFNGKFGE